MGVPVVTLHGSTHAGRMGASILRAAGQPGLVAADEDEFAALCARLAADADGLMRFRRTAREAMRASPLMDEGRFARDFEDCLRAMEARVP